MARIGLLQPSRVVGLANWSVLGHDVVSEVRISKEVGWLFAKNHIVPFCNAVSVIIGCTEFAAIVNDTQQVHMLAFIV
jgi:hypothetical protein